ncbi:MAG: response regulator [Verrucomicrobiales bacterium]|nr:response regulator [Verrucomicrobiales bacterium]
MKNRMPTHPHHSTPPVLPPANQFTIFVVDDLPQNRMILGKFLKTAGYAVVEATNGVEALEMLREGGVCPDLIVTDVEMPVMDGITMVEQIRYLDSKVADVPIITASGNADEEMQRDALAVGSDVFLTKPFDLRELAREIGRQLKKARRDPARDNSTGSPTGGNRFDQGLQVNS